MDKQLSISHAKILMDRCVFNVSRVKPFLDKVAKYRKTWNESLGKYMAEPYHNEASNYADCFQYLSQAVGHLEAAGQITGALEKHRKAVDSRHKRVI
jgi:superfamily II helicase